MIILIDRVSVLGQGEKALKLLTNRPVLETARSNCNEIPANWSIWPLCGSGPVMLIGNAWRFEPNCDMTLPFILSKRSSLSMSVAGRQIDRMGAMIVSKQSA